MALSKIKKVYLLSLVESHKALIRHLQKTGLVQIIENKLELTGEAFIEKVADFESSIKQEAQQLETILARVQWLTQRLEKFRPAKNLLENLLTPKEYVDMEEFENVSTFSIDSLFKRVQLIEEKEHQIQKELRKNRHLMRTLSLFKGLSFDLKHFNDARKISVQLVALDKGLKNKLTRQLSELFKDDFAIEELNQTKTKTLLLLLLPIRLKEEFLKWAENQSFDLLKVPQLSGTADEIVKNLQLKNNKLLQEEEQLKRDLRILSSNLSQLFLLEDYLQNRLEQIKKLQLASQSSFTKLIIGWIREKDILKFEEGLKQFPNVGWFFEEPTAEENPPVDYENPPTVKPFEFVTDLYSRPKYWELDPTPFLSAFFALFFGICLTDAGYGLTLTFFTALALKKFSNLTLNSKKLLKILFYSGILTTIIGLFTGGIFGLTPTDLPAPLTSLNKLVLLNPLQNQMGFLIFSLSLGILHISLGIFLKFYWNLKHQQKAEAWFDQAPWLAIILGVVVLFVASHIQTIWLSKFGWFLLIAASVIILLFAGRDSKNPFARFAKGFYSLYQVSGLLGDVLSYARLFALGLATGVIAGVVNFLAKLTLGIPYLGFFLMPVVLIFGHLLNLIINALGGFIHTARLQFVEFFGKFYEGGGEPFEPFQLNLKYTKIKRQE